MKRHGCPSHGIGLTPDEREIWLTDGANSRLHVFDNTVAPPRQVASLVVRDQPGWITFSMNGRHAYPSTGEIIDIATVACGDADRRDRARRAEREGRGDRVSGDRPIAYRRSVRDRTRPEGRPEARAASGPRRARAVGQPHGDQHRSAGRGLESEHGLRRRVVLRQEARAVEPRALFGRRPRLGDPAVEGQTVRPRCPTLFPIVRRRLRPVSAAPLDGVSPSIGWGATMTVSASAT